MPLIHAKLIYTASIQGALSDHVINTNDQGTIQSIKPLLTYSDRSGIQSFPGILIPGFINAHCHLELSHMKGLIPTGTGLVEFIQQIVTRRASTLESIANAIAHADQSMYDQGIVAVGDISNVSDTFEQKQSSKLRYHTFVETFDLLQAENAEIELEKAKKNFDQLNCPPGHQKAIVPHATYSVSDRLFELIRNLNQDHVSTSIHHQETEAENQFVATKTGPLASFFERFGLNLDSFHPSGQMASSVPIRFMSPAQKTLLVHNTMSTTSDIEALEAWNKEVYWVTCPNANLYIENRMPHYQYWLDRESKVCIGTDSLASNWQLSIFEEIKSIQRYQSYVPFEKLIQWATINGAKALGFNHELGSIEVGKKPGLVHIFPFDFEHKNILPNSSCNRII